MRGRIAGAVRIVVALVIGTIVSTTGASAAASDTGAPAGGIGVRLVPEESGPAQGALARSYIVEQLAPGATEVRHIAISNTTHSPANVAVYPAAANVERGGFAFAPGRSQNELTGWTSVSRTTLRLRPGGTTVEAVTIEVPKQASPGEGYAVVWAQVSAPATASGGITLVNRVGVRMYISIAPGGTPSSRFTVSPLTVGRSATGDPIIHTSIRNSGERSLEIRGYLTLSDGPGGLRAGPIPVTLGTPVLAPHNSESATVHLDSRLPRGPWQAHLQLTSGSAQRAVTQWVEFPLRATSVTGSSHRRLAITIILVLLGVVALLTLRRARDESRLHRSKHAPSSQPPRVPQGR